MIYVSVVIPVYNVGKYIVKCLDSVISQTYPNLEIILVDDGSTDNSGDICNEYASKDSRIKAIHKNNGGLMSAWITGVNASSGEYVTFVDSDDWIDEDTIKEFVQCLNSYKCDLIIANHINEYENESIKNTQKCPQGFYDESGITSKIFPVLLNDESYFGKYLNFCRWGKLIKTEIIRKNLNYCNDMISYGEDVNIMFPIFLDCQTYFVMDKYFYHYRQEKNSIMHSYKKNMEYQIDALDEALVLVNEDKRKFDFSMQINNNYLCMTLAFVRNEFNSNLQITKIINTISNACSKPRVRMVIKHNSVRNLSIFDKLLMKGIISNNKVYLGILYHMYKIKQKAINENMKFYGS